MLGDLDLLRLRKTLRGLTAPIDLRFHPTSPRGALSDEMEACALEIEKAGGGAVTLRVADGEESRVLPERPALSLGSRGKCNIHYLGIPQGPELLPFLEALQALPAGAAGHTQPWVAGLARLRREARLYVFMTIACPHCPAAVQAAIKLSLVSGLVHSVIIDSERFGGLARRFSVRSVPTTVLDEGWSAVGVLEAEELGRIILERETPTFGARVFESMLDTGRIEEAAARLTGEEADLFAGSWKRASLSRRMGLMLVAEKLLREDPRRLDAQVGELTGLLGSADASLRGDTADLLGRIGCVDARGALEALLADPNPDVAEVARQALEEIGKRQAREP